MLLYRKTFILSILMLSYYNFGVKLFNMKMFQEALNPIQSSCDLFLQHGKLNK